MGLTSAIHIGRSALQASQLGIQVAGNNMANAATPGYSRQSLALTPMRGDGTSIGGSVGLGVQVLDVRRKIDQALEGRLNASLGDRERTTALANIMSQVESALGELGDNDLSSELSSFFTAWSERANQSQSASVVVQQGRKLADFMQSLRSRLSDQTAQIDRELGAATAEANALTGQIADLNGSIFDAEGSGNTANTLRDQRDQLVAQLSGLVDVSVVDRGQQGIDVLIGSSPVVLGARSRGIELRRDIEGDATVFSLQTITDQSQLSVESGRIGGLITARVDSTGGTIESLDDLAAGVIFQVNRLHSTGRTRAGVTGANATLGIRAADRGLAINDGANASFNGLPFAANNGGFSLTVRDQAGGQSRTARIDVDLDGLTAAGAAGTADDTSAQDIADSINAINGLSASFSADGKLGITADPGFSFNFADDSSGVLAVMGVNSYFTGNDASSIAVNEELIANPTRLSAGRDENGVFVENGTALAISALQTTGIDSLGGRSVTEYWRDTVQATGTRTASTTSLAEAAAVVHESLEAQRAAVSGVNIDEESIDLMNYQRQYQGAARLISIANELTQTLMGLL